MPDRELYCPWCGLDECGVCGRGTAGPRRHGWASSVAVVSLVLLVAAVAAMGVVKWLG